MLERSQKESAMYFALNVTVNFGGHGGDLLIECLISDLTGEQVGAHLGIRAERNAVALFGAKPNRTSTLYDVLYGIAIGDECRL
jgi:hypothetical protein